MTEPRQPEFPEPEERPVPATPPAPELPTPPAPPAANQPPSWSFGAPEEANAAPAADPEPEGPRDALLPEPPAVHSTEEDVPAEVPAPEWTPAPPAEAAPERDPEPEPAPEPAPAPEPEPAPAPEPERTAETTPEPGPAAGEDAAARTEPEPVWQPQVPEPDAAQAEPTPERAVEPEAAASAPTHQQTPLSPVEPAVEAVAPASSWQPVPAPVEPEQEPVSEWAPQAQQPQPEPQQDEAGSPPESDQEASQPEPAHAAELENEPALPAETGGWTHTDRPVPQTAAATGADPQPGGSGWTAVPQPDAAATEPAQAAEDASAETVVAPTLPPAPPIGGFVPPVQAESETTQVLPASSARSPQGEPEEGSSEDDAIFRPYAGTLSGRLAASAEQNEEERKLAAERNALREARAAALTSAGIPEPSVGEAPAPVVQRVVEVKRTTDGFWGSLGLFLMRLVLAGVFGVWGIQMLLDPAKTQSLFASTILAYPILATIVPVASLLIAVSMVIGLATRYAAFGAALIAIGALVLVYWGTWSILLPNSFGFYGESELLIAAASLLLVFIGAGGWSLDGSLRRARAADKAARAS